MIPHHPTHAALSGTPSPSVGCCAPRASFLPSPFCCAHGPACNRVTPLHRAAIHGKKEVAELLIVNKADLNLKTHGG